MSLRLAVLKNVFDTYNTQAYSLIFFFIAVIYLIIKNKKEQRNLLIYEIFGILLLVTPFIGNKIVTLGAAESSNWPVYGVLCAIPLTAYAITEVFFETTNKKERYALCVAVIVILQLGLGLSFTRTQFGLNKTPMVTEKVLLEEDGKEFNLETEILEEEGR